MAELLKMERIRKLFSGTTVLHEVNFDLNYGELHALVGENGAGKSTLIKTLAGVHHADDGRIVLEGREVEFRSPKEAIRAGVSTIHQEFNLVSNLNVAANIFLGREKCSIRGVLDERTIYQETEKLLARVDARFDPKDQIAELGVAEKQLVEICKALSVNAKIVVMDEPTAVLSTREINKLFEVINGLKKEGLAIIYISHRLEELPLIAERVSVLRDGRMVGELSNAELSKEIITRMMIGREMTEQFPKNDREIGEEVLRVEDLNRGNIVRNVSLSVRKGEILGISGLVGSGRTEMVRAMLGFDKPDSGTLYINGKKETLRSPTHAKRMGIVMVPEERKTEGLVLSLSIENNLSLPYLRKLSRYAVVSDKKTRKNSEDIVGQITIKPGDINIKTKNLSGGNQQKVVIGKWIYTDHKVMIFDEPTRGVDVGAKAEIYKIMIDLAKKGLAIIMISSDLPEIIGMSDRVLVMRRGNISGELKKEELDEHTIMQLAF